LVTVACGSTIDDPNGAGGGGSYNGPEECPDAQISVNAPCLTALRARCLALPTEEACGGAEVVELGDPAEFQVRMGCQWATVISIEDSSTCSASEPFGRCEGLRLGVDGLCLGSACDAPGERAPWSILPTNPKEMVKMGCYGPVGYWWEVGYVREPDEGVCAEGTIPPAPPLCDCAEAACAKLGE